VFLGSRVVAVGHTGGTPIGTRTFAPIKPITEIKTEGAGAVVSLLAAADRHFLVIVNRDLDQPMPLEVRWEPAVTKSLVNKNGTLEPAAGQIHRTTVEPGDVDILAWSDS
jgi:hypothetical protein